jgi:hypothetical protein
MPNSKLTLSADKEVIERAKKLARENRTSVSAIFTRVVSAMTSERTSPKGLGPITKKASGLIKISPGKSDQKLLEDALSEKFGVR